MSDHAMNEYLKTLQSRLDANESRVDDYVVEQGASGIWTYRKWNSGIAECWGIWSGNLTNYASVFGGYGYYTAVTFPSNLFSATPIVTYSADGTNSFALTGTVTSSTTKTGTNVYAVCNSSGTRAFKFYITVIGKWK